MNPIVTPPPANIFQITDELVGREREVEALHQAFSQVCETGQFGVVSIVGKAGLGKTALVHRFLQSIETKDLLVAEARFGRNRSNEPLSAILEALTGLIKQIAVQPQQDQNMWRTRLLASLGDMGGVLNEVLPSLAGLIGPQPQMPPIFGEPATARLFEALSRFVRTFQHSPQPLLMYLDGLQWADRSSLKMLDFLCRSTSNNRLLLVLSYRDELTLEQIEDCSILSEKSQEFSLTRISLLPLNASDLSTLVARTLDCSIVQGRPLGQLIWQKTGGEPFYSHQFFKALYSQGHIFFSEEELGWSCDLGAIRQVTLTENIAAFMSHQMLELPAGVLDILQVMSCLGERADLLTLAKTLDRDRLLVARDLWESIAIGLVVLEREIRTFHKSANDEEIVDEFTVLYGDDLQYCLVHDHIRQAAYELIPKPKLSEFHNDISRRLLSLYDHDKSENALFDVLDKLSTSLAYITDQQEQQALAALFHQAGLKARSFIAYDESLRYLTRGVQVMGKDARTVDRQSYMNLSLEAATSALLASEFNTSFQILDDVEPCLQFKEEILHHALLKVQLCCLLNKLELALKVGYSSLKKGDRYPASLGANSDPIQRVEQVIFRQQREAADELGLMLLLVMTPAAFYTKAGAYRELVTAQVAYCTEFSAGSNALLAVLNYSTLFLGGRQHKLALTMLDRVSDEQQVFTDQNTHCRLDVLRTSLCRHWSEPLCPIVVDGALITQQCIGTGDYIFASYAALFTVEKSFFCCDELKQLEAQCREYAGFTGLVLHQVPNYQLSVWHQMVNNLIEPTDTPELLEGDCFSEAQLTSVLQANNNEMILFYLYFCKALLAFHFDKPQKAVQYVNQANVTLQSCSATYCGSVLAVFEIVFAFSNGSVDKARSLLRDFRLQGPDEQSHDFANFEHYKHLLAALETGADGKLEEALDHFQAAIGAAKKNQMVHDALVIEELLVRFYVQQGILDKAAELHARNCKAYSQWGAQAKVAQLKKRYVW